MSKINRNLIIEGVKGEVKIENLSVIAIGLLWCRGVAIWFEIKVGEFLLKSANLAEKLENFGRKVREFFLMNATSPCGVHSCGFVTALA